MNEAQINAITSEAFDGHIWLAADALAKTEPMDRVTAMELINDNLHLGKEGLKDLLRSKYGNEPVPMPAFQAFVEDIAEHFAKQHAAINDMLERNPEEEHPSLKCFKAQLRDDIIGVAILIRKHDSDYDLNKFYKKSGYEGTHPIH